MPLQEARMSSMYVSVQPPLRESASSSDEEEDSDIVPLRTQIRELTNQVERYKEENRQLKAQLQEAVRNKGKCIIV